MLETNDFALDYFGHQARTDVQLLLILLADSPDLDVLLIASEDLQLQVVVALQPVHRVDTGCNLSVRLPIMTKLVRSDLSQHCTTCVMKFSSPFSSMSKITSRPNWSPRAKYRPH